MYKPASHSFFVYAIFLLLLIPAYFAPAHGQEIRARVDLNTSQISSSDYDYLNELRTLIEEYVNETRWTEDSYLEDERIEVDIRITLTNADNNANFDANLIIQSSRPIYNTLAKTPLVLISDNAWRFNFTRNRNILRDDFQYDDIASVIDFYIFIVLAYDYDTFSELGGNPHLRRAENILNVAQSTGGASGWTSIGTRRNRHGLITQLNNPNYEGFRRALYKYHRLGLDQFTLNPDRARQNILEAFNLLQETRRQTTERYLFDLLFSAKNREFTAAFLDAELSTRLEAFNLLTELDPSHISEYEKLQ
ncbi:MAG: DUF4835 family protein [Candidatus Cyclonatronum sp.]|uniref:type IX secretion system protein PorD n=1 Tax=Cyclonatronum sp. TaxID=3024185 RepID=UPI0025BC9BAD|nr:DUF4835 family protein [Cyclonatronum sp.]MCC5933000.1 DUF4835 family protein [Balneolales bacterium]MCH8485283.1 DUF4835 family protein [Cyclonatronum sp.]